MLELYKNLLRYRKFVKCIQSYAWLKCVARNVNSQHFECTLSVDFGGERGWIDIRSLDIFVFFGNSAKERRFTGFPVPLTYIEMLCMNRYISTFRMHVKCRFRRWTGVNRYSITKYIRILHKFCKRTEIHRVSVTVIVDRNDARIMHQVSICSFQPPVRCTFRGWTGM